MVWVCDVRRGLRRKAGDGNGSTMEEARGRPKRRWLDGVKDDIKEKALSGWKCSTEPHGGEYRQTLTHIKVGIR